VSSNQSTCDGVPSYSDRIKFRQRAVIDDLLTMWNGNLSALARSMQLENSLVSKISRQSLAAYIKGTRRCPSAKLEALFEFKEKHRVNGQVSRSSRGIDALLRIVPTEAMKRGLTQQVAAEMAQSIRRGEHWDDIRTLSEGQHSYQSPSAAHQMFANFREVARAIVEVNAESDANRALAAYVGMRIAGSLWYVGKSDDQSLAVNTFRTSVRHLTRLQQSKQMFLSEANSILPVVSVEQSLIIAQHYCLSDNEILREFSTTTLQGSNRAVCAKGVDHHCVACALFSRCQDNARPSHLQGEDWGEALKIIESMPFKRVCEQTVEPQTAFYSNAIAGAIWARGNDFRRAKPHLNAARELVAAADTPSFVAFALYWWVVVNRRSPFAKSELLRAHKRLTIGAQNLCVTPLSKLKSDIEALLLELED